MRSHVVAIALVLLSPAVLWAKSVNFPERRTTVVGKFSIEHDPADSEYVRALTGQLEQLDIEGKPEPPPPFGFFELRAQRDSILQEIAQSLGSEKLSVEVAKFYDGMLDAQILLQRTMRAAAPRRFALWRKPDLVARLRAGQKIPGFTLEPGGDVNINFSVSFDTKEAATPQDTAAQIDKVWGELVWPVKIGEQSPDEDVKASLESLRHYKAAISSTEANLVMNTLHEAIEFTLVTEVIRSPDRRWFCEGVANYLALQIIAKRVGPELARSYYDVDGMLARAGDGAKQGDLEKWLVSESPAAEHTPGEINEANYLRATRVIQRVVEKHGTELLPKWIIEIRKTPERQRDIRMVHLAFKAVTGEDLQRYLEAL
jgi:hypothetical protein